MKKILLILNPRAGKMKSKAALFPIVETFCRGGCTVTIQVTEGPGHAAELACAAADGGYTLIACCGGDGTLNEVVSGNMRTEHPLPIGYIPAGSTNDFASSVGLPCKPARAAKLIAEGEPTPLDLGLFNGERHFTYIASFGAFTSVSYSASQPVKNMFGHFAYLLEGVKDLPNIKPCHVVAEADGRRYENDYIFGAACNATSVGGIVKLSADMVKMDDGLFEVVLIKKPANAVDLHKIVQCLARSDMQFDSDMIDFFQSADIRLRMEAAVQWSLDGECAPGHTAIRIENKKGALCLVK